MIGSQTSAWSAPRRVRTGFRINIMKLKEYVRFDSGLLSILLSAYYLLKYMCIKVCKNDISGLTVMGSMFRHTKFDRVREMATHYLLKAIAVHGVVRVGGEFRQGAARTISEKNEDKMRHSIESGHRLLHNRLLILSSPVEGAKGVLIVKFTESFKYVLRIFDMKSLCEDYVIIVEPSASGYFDEDILQLLSLEEPVLIQALEPVDYDFISKLQSNLIPIRIGANHWVDDRVFYPIDGVDKIYDVVMVAIWADVKRHYHLFEALSKIDKEMRIALVGAPWGKTIEQIKEEADYYGVLHRIDFFERLPQADINILLNQSKCFLLLSKKEGPNKAIIEAMYADVPVFILEGFNYGFPYPYINQSTGGFINPRDLRKFLLDLDEVLKNSTFAPREWIQAHVSAQASTRELIDQLNLVEREYRIKINKDLFIKINTPELDYYDKQAWGAVKLSMTDLKGYLRH